ncbi:transposase, partial [Candidatus Poribacteria bacterium]|nr:transposase [Candidatus Poribacteria bacterium]
WVILDNHYHLLMRITQKETLDKFLQHLHGASSFRLNQRDRCRGRRVWRNYWDRCPRSEKDFYTFFNYIHINPIKHGKVALRDGVILKGEEQIAIPRARMVDLHDALSQYEFSSYPYYLRKNGKEGMNHVWIDYPVVDHLTGDDFPD